MFNGFFHQPLIRFDTDVVTGVQVRNEKTARAQRPATHIDQFMVLSQPCCREQVKSHRCNQIVILWRSDISAVVRIAGRETDTQSIENWSSPH